MNGMHCKHFHKGTLLMVEHMTLGSTDKCRRCCGREFCVEGFFFSSAFEGAVSAHIL